MKLDLVVAGVGGQGNILASQVIAACAMDAGFNVATTETKGAAQRGGSVVSHVRLSYGEIYSPLVPLGRCDVLLGFEPLEGLRHLNLLNKQGKFIINTEPIPTILTNIKIDEYPSLEQINAEIKDKGFDGYFLNATQTAIDLGNKLLVNVVMLGAFTVISDVLPVTAVLDKLLSIVDSKFRHLDALGFNRGRTLMSSHSKI